jgi:uncharacterized protein (TIGR02246 family)
MKSRASIAVVVLVLAVGWGAAAEANGNEEQAVRSVVARFADAWNRHDMDAFAQLFAEDADFVNVVGTRWIGRTAIREAHAATHATIFKESRVTIEQTDVRFLDPDVAVTRSRWTLVGHTAPDGQPGAPRAGFLTNVLVQRDGRWEIAVSQNTDIVSRP